MKKISSKLLGTIIAVMFIISFYFVELSSIGSQSVAKYNNGYGTFDMKSYSPQIVSKVLGEMQEKGFDVYKKYYIADNFFVLTFGAVQIALLNVVYKWTNKRYRKMLWSIPVLRGVCDLIENILLTITLNDYPNVNNDLINIASTATGIKLLMIKVWSAVIIFGVIRNAIVKLNKR